MNEPQWVVRYLVALLATLLALSCVAASLAVWSLPAFAAVIVSVSVSSSYGGPGPGVFSVALGWTCANILFIHPVGELTIDGGTVRLLAAFLLALAVSELVRSHDPFGSARPG